MTHRWRARGLPASGYRVLMAVFASLPALMAVELLGEGINRHSMMLLGTVSLFCLGCAAYVWHRSRQVTVVSLDGHTLTVEAEGRARRHALSPGSLHAARWQSAGYANQGTVLFVRLDDGEVITLGVDGLLPDDRYAPDPVGSAAHFIDDGASLLERVRPFLMPTRLDAAIDDGAFTIPLHPWSRFGLPEAPIGWLTIVDRRVGLNLPGRGPAVSGQPHELRAAPGGYTQPMGDAPVQPWCPCIELTFPDGQAVRLGASTLDDTDRSWWGRAVGEVDRPELLMGAAELAKLADVLGLRSS